jgi:selenocysteine-specific elongation factor
VEGEGAQATPESVRALLVRQECEAPWALGLTLLALSKRLRISETQLHPLLRAFVDEGHIAYRGGYYATPEFSPELSGDQRRFFEMHLPVEARDANLPVSFSAVLNAMKASHIVGLAQAFDTLVAMGAVVRVGDDLYRDSQIDRLKRAVGAALRREERLTVAHVRDLAGISRKHVVPLLEWFDRIGLTVRDGDYRLAAGVSTPLEPTREPP